MPLTRGDKMIIIGAVALAATVVLGLAVLKKPYLFTGSKPQPAAVVPPPVQVPAAVPPSTAQPVTPMPKVEVAPPVQAPAAEPAPRAIPPAPTTASLDHPVEPGQAPGAAGHEMPVDTTHPAPAPQPQAATTPSSPGDATLEQMFADLANDMTQAPGHDKAKGQAAPEAPKDAAAAAQTPAAAPAPTPAATPDAAPEPASAPQAKSEPAKAKPAAKGHPAPTAKHESKAEAKHEPKPAKAASKPVEAAKPTPKPAPAKPVAATGNVIRVVAEEKPGEYTLLIETNKAPADYSKMFLTDPPRMVVDIGGSWRYNGPLSSATGNDFIRHIRVGKHRDKFRVVLDMAPNATTRLRGAPTLQRVPKGVELRIPK